MNKLRNTLSVFLLGLVLIACNNPNKTGWEFAPNMYNSPAYEAQTQWRTNDINPHGMNMREPVAGTVARVNYQTSYLQDDGSVVEDLMIYNLSKDSLDWAAKNLINPIPWSEESENEGKKLYERNCQHCHGAKGEGEGKVAEIYKGVPNYSSEALSTISEGHIYHVITFGKGRMWPHASQVTPAERWKIVHYVQRLQLGS
jgi:hypothetical protein